MKKVILFIKSILKFCATLLIVFQKVKIDAESIMKGDDVNDSKSDSLSESQRESES